MCLSPLWRLLCANHGYIHVCSCARIHAQVHINECIRRSEYRDRVNWAPSSIVVTLSIMNRMEPGIALKEAVKDSNW